MSNETYNGWTNKPTWCVNLWMDNDKGTQEYFREMAECLIDMHNKGDAIYEFAHCVELWVEEGMPELKGLPRDMMNYVMAVVDYREIAKAWIDEAILQKE